MEFIKNQGQPTQPSPSATPISELVLASPIQPTHLSPTFSLITSQTSPLRAIYLLPAPSSSSSQPTSPIIAILPQNSPKPSPSTSSSSSSSPFSHSSNSIEAISESEILLTKLQYLRIRKTSTSRKTSHTPNPTQSSQPSQTPSSSLLPTSSSQATQPPQPIEPANLQPPLPAKPDPPTAPNAPLECRHFTPKPIGPPNKAPIITRIISCYKKFEGIILPLLP